MLRESQRLLRLRLQVLEPARTANLTLGWLS